MLIGCAGHSAGTIRSDSVTVGSRSLMARATPTQLNSQQLLAESLHILRPLFHRIHSCVSELCAKLDCT